MFKIFIIFINLINVITFIIFICPNMEKGALTLGISMNYEKLSR